MFETTNIVSNKLFFWARVDYFAETTINTGQFSAGKSQLSYGYKKFKTDSVT